MAKTTITFTDMPDGKIDVYIEFDPPYEEGSSVLTKAQLAGKSFANLLAEQAGSMSQVNVVCH